jgi:flavin-binding protein dodecin
MSVARVTEISATNPDGFEAAIREAIDRATSTLRNVEGAWVKDAPWRSSGSRTNRTGPATR